MTAGSRFVQEVTAAMFAAGMGDGSMGDVAVTRYAGALAEALIARGIGFVALGGSGTVSSRPITDARARVTRTHDL